MQKVGQVGVERSIWINAPRKRVWQAILQPDQLAQWFMPPALGAQMKRDDKGMLFVSMGGMDIPVAVTEVVRELHQLISRSVPDMLLTTTYTLEDEKGGTRLTVTMSGFEALPEKAAQERLNPSSAGWEKALNNLKAYIDGAELPFPEGYVASLYGYRRESKEAFAVERSIWIDAPRERVWQAITDPKQLQQWYSPTTPWLLSALEVGGKFYIYNVETETEIYTEVIELLDPPHQLVKRLVAKPPETPHVIAWRLAEENGGTRVTITNSGYELESDSTRHPNMEQNAFGFGMMLENLKAYNEGKALPNPYGF
ncbi:MAG: SRPBCC family protein [Chloroflexota bacterium]